MFTFLYQNCPSFCNLCHTEEFIICLFSVLIPLDVMESCMQKDENSPSPTINNMQTGSSILSNEISIAQGVCRKLVEV